MRRSGVSLIGIALALAMVFSSRAYCDPLLTFEVFDPDRLNLPGSVYMFDGQITNNTGTPLRATDLFLNFFGFDPTVITANQLLGFPDFAIPDGGTSPVVPLFTLDFGSSADPTQVYLANVFLQDFTVSFFSPPVTVTIGPVPEPRGLWLHGLMLPIFLILRRRSRPSETTLKRIDAPRKRVFPLFALASLLLVALPA